MAMKHTFTTGSTLAFQATGPKVVVRTESTYDLYNPGDSQMIDEYGALQFRCDDSDRQHFRGLDAGEDL